MRWPWLERRTESLPPPGRPRSLLAALLAVAGAPLRHLLAPGLQRPALRHARSEYLFGALVVLWGCGDGDLKAGGALDAGGLDTGGLDATLDAGRLDAGRLDAGRLDAGRLDAALDVGRDSATPGDATPTLTDATAAADASPGTVDAAPLTCDPPNTVAVEGRCLPSCGGAGGNTCVAADSTLCDCLPAIESYDCARCCARPPEPPRPLASHHIVVIADRAHWDAIRALSDAGLGPMITSQNKPDDLPFERWTRNIHHSTYPTGEALADGIHQILCAPDGAPARVMIDEVRGESIDKIAAAAERLRTRYPQWAGRWGAYLVNGEGVSYPRLNPAIDALLDAHAVIGVELYVHQSRYCASGANAGARDVWLAGFFRGDENLGRFQWLADRRAGRGSQSHLTLLFGVTDAYLDGAQPAVFLDRMFYVWATRSGHPSVILQENGGVGAYKWEAADVGNTSRDLAFQEAYQHYGVMGLRTSRLGQVPCE